VPVHLDGARLFNAAVALGVPARALVADVDSVSFCLSKGLSAPAGAMLSGSVAFVAKARGYRRMVGGGMRQVGMLAAAGIVALEQGIGFLAGDHARARRLAEGLQTIPGFGVAMERVQTNLVVAEVRHGSAAALVSRLDAAGVRLRAIGPRQVRTQTHRMISAADIEEALDRIAAVMKRDVGAQEERT
jgi:threonine aldolase